MERGRLGDDIDRAPAEGLKCARAGGLALGADDDGGDGMEEHEAAQEGETVHARHLEVEGDDVGTEGEDLIAGDVGIGRGGDDFDVGLAGDGLGEDLADDG